LILLNRRRDSGALGWWITPEDAVLAPTKRTAEKKNAIPTASLEIIDLAFTIWFPSFFAFIIYYFSRKFYPFLLNGRKKDHFGHIRQK
jgi:hypothetical protein